MAITPDGSAALSGGRDSTRLWDLAGGHCLRTIWEARSLDSIALTTAGRLAPHSSNESVALTADGGLALAASSEEAVLWELDWDYEFPDAADGRPSLLTILCHPQPRGREFFSGPPHRSRALSPAPAGRA